MIQEKEEENERRGVLEDGIKGGLFEKALRRATTADRVWELIFFIRSLPPCLPSLIKENLIKQVKDELQIGDEGNMLLNMTDFTPSSRDWFETPLLDALSTKLGFSLSIIAPPTKCCLTCHSPLSASQHAPTQVQLHTRLGTKVVSKYILRCRHCDDRYHPTRYGDDQAGWKYYSNPGTMKLIEASTVVFMEEGLARLYSAEYLHGWLSAVAKCEAHNWANRDSYYEKATRAFLRHNPDVGRQFNSKERGDGADQEDQEESSQSLMYHMSRKSLSQSLLNYEMKEELKESGELIKVSFGPKEVSGKRISFKESRENYFERVDLRRKENLYPHEVCHEGCRRRGCLEVSTFDGLWKIQVISIFINTGDEEFAKIKWAFA